MPLCPLLYLPCCLQVSDVSFERQPIADHATQLAATIQQNLKRSMEGLGVVSDTRPFIKHWACTGLRGLQLVFLCWNTFGATSQFWHCKVLLLLVRDGVQCA